MKSYTWIEQDFDESGNEIGPKRVTMTEDEIYDIYWPGWYSRMVEKFGEGHHLITRQNCIMDFAVVHWAEDVEIIEKRAQDAATYQTSIQRFTAYRRNLSARGTHTAEQANDDSEPQYEGVIWSDGSVTLRWRTACRSTSVWNSIEDMLLIHGHPEYGTEIIWHDSQAPKAWVDAVEKYELSKLETGEAS